MSSSNNIKIDFSKRVLDIEELVKRFYVLNDIEERYGLSLKETIYAVRSYFQMMKDVIQFHSVPRIMFPYIGSFRSTGKKMIWFIKRVERQRREGHINETVFAMSITKAINWLQDNYNRLRPKIREKADYYIEKYANFIMK